MRLVEIEPGVSFDCNGNLIINIDLEKRLHGLFNHKQAHEEWFLLDDDELNQAVSICRERGRTEFGEQT